MFAELRRVVVRARAALDGLELMDAIGVTDAVLPELAALRGVEQSRFHHLDVADHTARCWPRRSRSSAIPRGCAGDHAPALARFLAEPLADDMTRGQALRFGALLHDIAKPQTRAVTPQGRVTFMGHDEAGARLAQRDPGPAAGL